MNLEDRLRSHMHSGNDLFVETGPDAGAITASGRRRTRRNQIGGAAAGGVVALALVFGITSQLSSTDTDAVASPALAEAELAPEIESGDMSDVVEEAELDNFAEDEIGESMLVDRFVEFELVVGVADGFAGLRTTEDGIVAIESDDGIEWVETQTTGIPDGAEIVALTHGSGVFAASIAGFDDAGISTTSSIGTSADLQTWNVVPVEFDDVRSPPWEEPEHG